jgi:hypothetical protein
MMVLLVAFVSIIGLASQPAAAQNNTNEARAMLAALNEWRIGMGLGPLRSNPTLERMAVQQAQFVLTQNPIPSGAAIHIGPRGEDPRTRALYPENNWPVYGQREQLVFSEIAALQPNIRRATDWWRGSDIHNRSVTNPWFREVGVAAVPYRLGFAYFVVLAGEPNVLPALADPRAGVIYLTNELYPRGQGDWLRNADQIRVFGGDGRPLTDWQPWAASIPIPAGAREMVVVAYRASSSAQVLAVVSLRPQDVDLPQYAADWGGGVSSPMVAAMPTDAAALVPATNTPNPRVPAAAPTVPPPPTATFAPAPPAQLPAPGGRQITLVYDLATLTVVPGQAGIDVSGLVLTDGSVTVRLGNLNAQFLRGTLTALGSTDCLFITTDRNVTRTGVTCGFTSTTFLTPDRAVWARNFRVERAASLLAQCQAADRRCVVAVN